MTRNGQKTSYSVLLKDPRWQKNRLEAMERAGWCCELCGDKESMLNVHHKKYFKGRMPWEYDSEQLAVLCESCHTLEHEQSSLELLDDVISRLPLDGPMSASDVGILVAAFTGVKIGADDGFAKSIISHINEEEIKKFRDLWDEIFWNATRSRYQELYGDEGTCSVDDGWTK